MKESGQETRGSYDQIIEALLDVDWEYELGYLDVLTQHRVIMSYIRRLIGKYVPRKSNKDRNTPWCLNAPRSLKILKQDARRHFKVVRGQFGRSSPLTQEAWHEFTLANRELKLYLMISQKAYERLFVLQLDTSVP